MPNTIDLYWYDLRALDVLPQQLINMVVGEDITLSFKARPNFDADQTGKNLELRVGNPDSNAILAFSNARFINRLDDKFDLVIQANETTAVKPFTYIWQLWDTAPTEQNLLAYGLWTFEWSVLYVDINQPVITPLPVNFGGTGSDLSNTQGLLYQITTGSDVTTIGLSSDFAINSGQLIISASLGAWASKTPPIGDVVGTTDTQSLSNKTLLVPIIDSNKGSTESILYSSSVVLDLQISTWKRIALDGNITLSLTGEAGIRSFTLELTQNSPGGHTVTWWSGIVWMTPTNQPAAVTGKITFYTFVRHTTGEYLGFSSPQP